MVFLVRTYWELNAVTIFTIPMSSITTIRERIHTTYPHQPTFLQAVDEVLGTLAPYLESVAATEADYGRLERLLSPERVFSKYCGVMIRVYCNIILVTVSSSVQHLVPTKVDSGLMRV